MLSLYRNNSCWKSSCVALLGLVCLFVLSSYNQESRIAIFRKKEIATQNDSFPKLKPHHVHRSNNDWDSVLKQLVEAGVYNSTRDFENELGVVPPYWQARRQPDDHHASKVMEWGPCYGTTTGIDWEAEIARYNTDPRDEPRYPRAPFTSSMTKEERNFENFCRPGFLIIGAGKCGTSSLYHYITDHPRVLPASEKQIHYFKYFADRSMQWYLSHFPSTTSFLASGALLTGEASPGYLPYPDVVPLVKERMEAGPSGSTPRLVVVGREPVDRAYSSYRYNYVAPAIEAMREGKLSTSTSTIRPGEPNDKYYEPFLFSFEEMVQAELAVLRTCLTAPNGFAISVAKAKWGNQSWIQPEYERREKLGLDPLVDLDGFCYGAKVSKTVLRRQWTNLTSQHPTKVIPNKNVHLIQSMVGRGIYAFPLEWWYAVFEKKDIYFLCTEELTDMTGEPVNKVGQFLGLPSFNFSETVSRGAYNVGNHKGYDNEVSWSKLEKERAANATGANTPGKAAIPLSESVRRELDDFYRPYNERLFQLVGRRCSW